jgi:hypothetical protein
VTTDPLDHLERLDLGHPADGTLFNEPATADQDARITLQPTPAVTSGYVRRLPQAPEPNGHRYRIVLTHMLDVTEPDVSGRDVEGLTVVAPVYATAKHSHPDPSQSPETAAKYYAAIGWPIGWVTIGEDPTGIWVSGIVLNDLPDRLRAALDGRKVEIDVRRDSDGWPAACGLYVPVPTAAHPHATSLTKGDLLRLFTGDGMFADLPDDTPLIVQEDAEGSGFSPLCSAELGVYMPESTWSGHVNYDPDPDDPNGIKVIVLGPVN